MSYVQDNILVPDPRKSKGKHAVCLRLSKEWRQNQNRPEWPAGFYVKGNIQGWYFKMVKLLEQKDGSFLFPVPGNIRRRLKLKAGDTLCPYTLTKDRLYHGMHHDLQQVFFKQPQEALIFYHTLGKLEKHRFHEWIFVAPTDQERATRITKMIEAMHNKQTFKQMKAAGNR